MKISIAEARRNLPTLVRKAEAGNALELTRRGQPVAILLGCSEFERLTSGRTSFADAFENFCRKWNLADLELDPDKLFGDVRDRSPGREFEL